MPRINPGDRVRTNDKYEAKKWGHDEGVVLSVDYPDSMWKIEVNLDVSGDKPVHNVQGIYAEEELDVIEEDS